MARLTLDYGDAIYGLQLQDQVIADFANGEISQQQKVFDTSITLEEYMDKNFYKTASLIAASCKSAAVFSGCSEEIKDSMFEYGRHLGLAFQIIDDILDFTQSAEQLGKPQVCLCYLTFQLQDLFTSSAPQASAILLLHFSCLWAAGSYIWAILTP